MTYQCVIPRDLFNESKLLKCLGRLYIGSEVTSHTEIAMELVGERFSIEQDPSDGSICVSNLMVTVNGVPVRLSTPLNSQGEYPLYANVIGTNECGIPVFATSHRLTPEFCKIGKGKAAT